MNISLIRDDVRGELRRGGRVDLSVAVPLVHTSVQGTSVATIHPAGYPSPHASPVPTRRPS